jgi:uncharacterized RDD family membrane protein YckC
MSEEKENHLDEFVSTEKEISYGKKFLAGLIDGIIIIGFFTTALVLLPNFYFIIFGSLRAEFAIIIGLVVMRLFSIQLFNGTPGMLICRAKYLNAAMKPPSVLERTFAACFILINGIRYYDK